MMSVIGMSVNIEPRCHGNGHLKAALKCHILNKILSNFIIMMNSKIWIVEN